MSKLNNRNVYNYDCDMKIENIITVIMVIVDDCNDCKLRHTSESELVWLSALYLLTRIVVIIIFFNTFFIIDSQ